MLQSFVDMYNGKNPDVPVKIEYGYTSEDGKTREDALKLFNTELLAGKAADILMLDGMPVMTYGKEETLTDLNKVMDMSAITPDIFSNMLNLIKKARFNTQFHVDFIYMEFWEKKNM